MDKPLVTVGIALYNHENYIEQCLASVIAQTYSNIEICVVDDGSKDGSYDVARRFLEMQQNITFTLKTRKNIGMCNTLNEIAQNTKSKYISFIGSDDYWKENKIADQVAFLEEHENLILVHSNSIKVDSQGNEIKKNDYSTKINNGSVYEARFFMSVDYNLHSITPINKSKSLRPVLIKLFTLGLIGNDISYLQYVIVANK